jgi:hypothetical protein
MKLGVGMTLHPDREYLELCREILEEDADFYEVSPETLWRREAGALVRNRYHATFKEIRARSGKPFVAHGLAFSIGSGTGNVAERARTAAWLERLRDDHACFPFAWMT